MAWHSLWSVLVICSSSKRDLCKHWIRCRGHISIAPRSNTYWGQPNVFKFWDRSIRSKVNCTRDLMQYLKLAGCSMRWDVIMMQSSARQLGYPWDLAVE